jgi:mannosyltransferase
MATKSINSYLSQMVETATRSFRDASVATVSKNINLTKNSTLIVLSLLGITTLAVFLRLLFLGADSFWADEIFSVSQARARNWSEFWDGIFPLEVNMAPYYVLLRFWLNLGTSEFIIRSLSVVFAVATVPAIYALGTRLFGVWVGLIAALLVTINAFHIEYSQEARGYSMVVLLVTLSSLLLIRGVERPSWTNWAAYVILSTLAVYTHFYSGLVLLAHAISLLFLSPGALPWKGLVPSAAIIGVLSFPAAYFLRIKLQTDVSAPDVGDGPVWSLEILESNLHRFFSPLTGDMGSQYGNILLLIYLFAVFVACIVGVRTLLGSKRSIEGRKFLLLLSWLFVPLSIGLALSLIADKVLPKHFIVCLPALALLAAVGISHIARIGFPRTPTPARRFFPVASALLLAAIAAVSAQEIFAYHTAPPHEDWKSAADWVESEWQSGDGMLFYVPRMEKKFRYYFRNPEAATIVDYGRWKDFVRSDEVVDPQSFSEFLPDHNDRVWFVQDVGDNPDHRAAVSNIHAALGSKYSFGSQKYFYGGVRVAVYSRDELADIKSLSIVTPDQPWRATSGMIAAPLRIVADESSVGYIAQVEGAGGGSAVYDFNITEGGMYQFAARARSGKSEMDSLEVILDGQEPANLVIGGLSGWSWVPGPVYELSAGSHRIELSFQDADVQVDWLALNNRGNLAPDQPWEAENAVIVPPLRVMVNQSSNGYIAQVDGLGGGYALYNVAIPKSGKYQIKGKVKSTEGLSDTIEVTLDGQEPSNWVIDHQSNWQWASGPIFELSAGIYRIKLAFRDADIQIDRIELKSR